MVQGPKLGGSILCTFKPGAFCQAKGLCGWAGAKRARFKALAKPKRHPVSLNVPVLTASFCSPLDGCWAILKGGWGVLDLAMV